MPRFRPDDLAGRPAPALTLPTERGEMFDLAEHRDRPVLVTFLSHGG